MGAEQTLTSRNSQENVTSNNALSINDSSSHGLSLQRKANVANNTGLPDSLKRGVESLSGCSLDDVRVHYNSSKPAAVQAYAYTQGTDIHIAPGQERCLPHEAWHVTQQMSGRVSPTTSIGGVAVNDDASLEHEADVMGARASTLQGNNYAPVSRKAWSSSSVRQNKSLTIQREGAGGGAQGVSLTENAGVISKFKGKNFIKNCYTAGGQGNFDVRYSPSEKLLNVDLPVKYDSSMNLPNVEGGKERKAIFKKNVEDTWGDKYHIDFQDTRLEKGQSRPAKLENGREDSSDKTWKRALNHTKVQVNVKETKSGEDPYFNISARSSATPSLVRNYINPDVRGRDGRMGDVELREDIFGDTLGPVGVGATYNEMAHEAGHMFGLGDEYIANGSNDGDPSTHYELVKKAFGEDYANSHAKMSDAWRGEKGDRVGVKDDPIMQAGGTVKKHHYVTFWDAMVKAIQSDSEYGSTPSSEAPNQHEDWTIVPK
jgi:hypothetical protein